MTNLAMARFAREFNRLVWAGAMDREFREEDVKRDDGGKFAEQAGVGKTAKPASGKKRPGKAAKPKMTASAMGRLRDALKDHPELLAKVEEALGQASRSLASAQKVRSVGEPRKIVTPDGKMEVTAKPEIVELADLIHAKGDLQPRNRDTAESRTTARERASKLDPEQLLPGRVSDAGAPIIDESGTVISGNGRTMSLREVYNDPAFKAKAQAYRKALGGQTKGMKQPVLVMRLPEGMSHGQLVEFADRSNRSRIEAMSATERAQRDAKVAGLDVISLYRGGDFTSSENRAFMHAFTQKAMSANERAQFSKEGRLTKEGQDRLSAAVLASAYDDVDALSLMLESTDDNVKAITNAMKDTAGRFAELKAGVAAGRVLPEMDVTVQIAGAAKLISSLRKKGISPASHFAQMDAFSRPDPMIESLVRSFYNDSLSRSLSQQKIGAILGAYADEAMKHQPGGFLPDDTKAPEVLAAASNKAKSQAGSEGPDLFGGNAGNEPGNGRGGERNRRRSTSKGSRKTGKGRKGVTGDGAVPYSLADLARDFKRILARSRLAQDARDFDENKVKRAKNGQFAKQAGEGEGAKTKPAKEKKPKAEKEPAPRAKPKKEAKARIEDIGEKIGGARKDRAASAGPRAQRPKAEITAPGDKRPEWERRYQAVQNMKDGSWTLHDGKSKSRFGGWLPMRFSSKEEAEAARPLVAVSRNHKVRMDNDGRFSIWRDVTDRKHVKVVPESFATRDDAMKYMAQNAEKILSTKTGFGEEILAKPEKVYRTGESTRKGDVEPEAFKNSLGFRGVEFGHWQDERQQVLNHAHDALHDLSEVTGIHPADLSLNGQLGLAFGARGHGLSGSRAHYERPYAVMNLTKMKGAGSLAHEWMHALDHYLGRVDEPKYTQTETNAEGHRVFKTSDTRQDFASHRTTSPYYGNGKIPEKVRNAHAALMRAMTHKAVQYTEDTERATKFVNDAREGLKSELGSIRANLAKQLEYGKRNVKPASEKQLQRFDAAAERLLSGGENLATQWRPNTSEKAAKARGGMAGRFSNDALDEVSKVLKEVRGTSGFASGDRTGWLDTVRYKMNTLASRQKMLDDAAAQSVKTRMVPTSYAMEAKKIDQGRVENYWQTPHEMKARAFSSFIEDALAGKQRRSDYLSYGSDNRHYRMHEIKPFPEGEERATINKHFANLFDEMRKAGLVRARPAKETRAKKAKGAQDSARVIHLTRLAHDFNCLLKAA